MPPILKPTEQSTSLHLIQGLLAREMSPVDVYAKVLVSCLLYTHQKLPGQSSIWQLITPQSDVCIQKSDIFSRVFDRDAFNIYHIENRKAGGESAHDFASFLYTSLCGVINCQILISFLFVPGTKGRMQPVVMAPKNLSTKH